MGVGRSPGCPRDSCVPTRVSGCVFVAVMGVLDSRVVHERVCVPDNLKWTHRVRIRVRVGGSPRELRARLCVSVCVTERFLWGTEGTVSGVRVRDSGLGTESNLTSP